MSGTRPGRPPCRRARRPVASVPSGQTTALRRPGWTRCPVVRCTLRLATDGTHDRRAEPGRVTLGRKARHHGRPAVQSVASGPATGGQTEARRGPASASGRATGAPGKRSRPAGRHRPARQGQPDPRRDRPAGRRSGRGSRRAQANGPDPPGPTAPGSSMRGERRSAQDREHSDGESRPPRRRGQIRPVAARFPCSPARHAQRRVVAFSLRQLGVEARAPIVLSVSSRRRPRAPPFRSVFIETLPESRQARLEPGLRRVLRDAERIRRLAHGKSDHVMEDHRGPDRPRKPRQRLVQLDRFRRSPARRPASS